MPPALSLPCRAKINTTLAVLGRRPDGYHELETEFVSVAACDWLHLDPAAEFSLTVSGSDAVSGLADDTNLVLVAARLLQAELGRADLPGAHFHLEKHLPVAAGLGGGSSDAAGAIVGLCRLHGLEVDSALLARVALQVGSDVPYFLLGGRALGRGRGEALTPLPDPDPMDVLLVNPPWPVATREVFAEHALTQPPAPPLTSRNPGISFLARPQVDPQEVPLWNDLWQAAIKVAPGLAELRVRLEQALPEAQVGLSGSGPTLFALLPAGQGARGDAALRNVELPQGTRVLVTRWVGRAEYATGFLVPNGTR